MPQPAMSAASVADTTAVDRRPRLIAQLKDLFEDVAGFDMADAEADANFMELGLDSLMLTQVALQLEKAFGVKVSFRQLMGECASLGRLAGMIDAQLPPEVAAPAPAATPAVAIARHCRAGCGARRAGDGRGWRLRPPGDRPADATDGAAARAAERQRGGRIGARAAGTCAQSPCRRPRQRRRRRRPVRPDARCSLRPQATAATRKLRSRTPSTT